MAVILDTNALSAADGQESRRQAIESEDDLFIPVIVPGEYLFGIRQSRHRARYEQWLKTRFTVFALLEIERETASRYAEIRSELKSMGQPIPTNDLVDRRLSAPARVPAGNPRPPLSSRTRADSDRLVDASDQTAARPTNRPRRIFYTEIDDQGL